MHFCDRVYFFDMLFFHLSIKNNSRNSNNRQQILHIGDLESLIILGEIKKIYLAA